MNHNNWKDKIAGVAEMAEIWNISPNYLKTLCRKGRVDAIKIGKTWIIYKEQPRPEIQHYNWKNK